MNKRISMKETGITLIALVVTIIILLILAGISINMVMGSNGIIERTKDAKAFSERQEIIEKAKMDILDKQTENYGSITEDELIEILTSSNYSTKGTLSDNNEESILQKTLTSSDGKYQILVSEIYNGSFSIANLEVGDTLLGPNGKPLINQETVSEITEEQILGEDILGNQVVIPEGFKLAQGENGSGETVKEGIVIEDEAGNQYVWVPVSNTNHDGSNKIKVDSAAEEGIEITLGRYIFASSSPGNPTLQENSYQYASNYNTSVRIGSYFEELTTYRQSNGLYSGTLGTNTTARGVLENNSYNGIKGFIESVDNYKGYYIARYEASYRTNNKAGSIPSTSSAETLALTSAPATRNEGDLWNLVTQGQAAKACYDLYTTINSDLINSYAWDTTIIFIQSMGNTNYANAHNNSALSNTGSTSDEKCKIFDLSGNGYEWSTEYSSYLYPSKSGSKAQPCVLRGDGRWSSVYRTYSPADYKYKDLSFRPILYL